MIKWHWNRIDHLSCVLFRKHGHLWWHWCWCAEELSGVCNGQHHLLGLKESTTSEQSARMTAMDSASKNACESFYMSPSFHFQVWSLLMLSLILKNSHLQSCLFSSLHQLRWLTSWLWPSTEPARPSSLRSSLRSFLEPLLCKMFFLFLCSSFTLIITHACHLLSSSILSLGYGFLMSFSVTSTACLYLF